MTRSRPGKDFWKRSLRLVDPHDGVTSAARGLRLTSLLFQQLCAMSEIATSEEMQEFLALNTDARIAFVKKPFIVSRIDKVSPLGNPGGFDSSVQLAGVVA